MNETDDGPRATWRPDPKKAWPSQRTLDRLDSSGSPHGPGLRFTPDGLGGGLLLVWSKTTYAWRLVCQKLPHGA